MPAWQPIRRWPRDWVSHRGGFALALLLSAVALQLVSLLPVPGWLISALTSGIAVGTAVCWLRPLFDLEFDRRLRWAVLAMVLASGFSALGNGLGAVAQLAELAKLGSWAAMVMFVAGPVNVVSLLLWPADRGPRYWGYLAVDLAVILLAVGLFFWYTGGGWPNLATEIGVSSLTSAAMLAGVSVATLRGSAAEWAAPFALSVVSQVTFFVANFGLTVAQTPERFFFLLSPLLTLVFVGANIAAAEAVRLRWKWPWADASVEGTSPVPWVAVAAIALIVARKGLDATDPSVGPVIIVIIAAVILLVVRQMIAMRHNSRLQAAQAAIEADTRIAALVRHTSDIILIADADLTLQYAAPSAEALWSRTPAQLIGAKLRTLVDQPSQADFERILTERLAQPGQSDVVRVRVTTPEGTNHRIEAVVISLLHEPTVGGVVVTMRDQTERIQLEEQLGQSQKMEAVGQLAGGVAHDFNNLLTTIMGHSDVAADLLPEDHPVRDDLAQIKRASELAASLTRQLLMFSRKQVIEPRIIDVAASVETVVRMVRRLIKEDVVIALDVSPDLGPVRVDPSQLEQVVLNLAVNARDAMPKGGRLAIRVRQTVVTGPMPGAVIAVPLGECTVIEVIDTGIGMDPATQARIFEPFFTTKPAGHGTGLGLATVYGVVKQSGGGLVLTSAIGRGTTFAVYLGRVAPAAPAEPESAEAARVPLRFAATILLVEDETGLREIANKVLAREGFRVLVAADGEDALTIEASAQFPIDLLLTDIVMPGMSGPTLAAQLKPKRPDMRVLLMSGYPGDDLTGELKPNERFLRKPFTPYVLLEHVRAALDPSSGPPTRRPGQ